MIFPSESVLYYENDNNTKTFYHIPSYFPAVVHTSILEEQYSTEENIRMKYGPKYGISA